MGYRLQELLTETPSAQSPSLSEDALGRVAPGDFSPRAPTDPYLHFRAYGSSYHERTTGRHTEWIGLGGGNGYRFSNRVNRCQGMVPLRRRRESHFLQIRTTVQRNRDRATELPVIP